MTRRDLLDVLGRRVQKELILRAGIRCDVTQRRQPDSLRAARLLCEGSERDTEQGRKHPDQASWFWRR
jgi:hypothetical protein